MTDEQIIWNYLKNSGYNDYGVAGLMGNLKAESNLNPKNLQDTFNISLNLSDDEYTKKVDDGSYTNFIYDGAGYGIAQHTWWTRKKALLEFAKQKNKSIGDLDIQLEFLIKELTTLFPKVDKMLKTATNVKQASDFVLINFEAPLNQSEAVKNQRAASGQQYYDKYAKGVEIKMGNNMYMKGYKTQTSKNTYSTEFDCHGYGCCSQTIINPKLVEIVQDIRDHFNKPITITSGYRCPIHNSKVGGATGSRHSAGDAADIVVQGIAPAEVAKYAESKGVKGIGLYETSADGFFTHVDTRSNKSFWYGQKQSPRTTFNTTINSSTTANQNRTTLLIGSKGEAVKTLQENLNSLNYDCGIADGIFGDKTKQAVIKFQKEHNLEQDGIAGPATLSAVASAKKLVIGNKMVKVTASLLNVRNASSINGTIISRLQNGTVIEIEKEENGWGKIVNSGWISLQYVKEI